MRYKLYFNGFYDTWENLFGSSPKSIEEDIDANLIDLDNLLENCILEFNKLELNIDKSNISNIQLMQLSNYMVATKVIGQQKYMILVNLNSLKNYSILISALYHELCHVYQLDRLFTEKIIAYDYIESSLIAGDANKLDIFKKHICINNGHTEYWQLAADKVNTLLKPDKKLKPYMTTDEVELLSEAFIAKHYKLDFTGFYDALEDLSDKK